MLPLPSLLGPKCLRLAGIIQNGCLTQPRRKNTEEASSSRPSVEAVGVVDSGHEVARNHVHIAQEFQLEVVLPFLPMDNTASGVQHLLGEDSLGDVDGFVAARDNPIVQELEAEKLLIDQQQLG
jgi:DNA polymerase II small subunit/DNA polymerase delta subunit B